MAGFPNAQNNPAGAIPVYITAGAFGGVVAVDKSVTLTATVAAEVCAENTSRRYLLIQALTGAVWVSFVGTAAPSAAGSFQLASGQTYEALQGVVANAVSVYSAAGTICTVYEG